MKRELWPMDFRFVINCPSKVAHVAPQSDAVSRDALEVSESTRAAKQRCCDKDTVKKLQIALKSNMALAHVLSAVTNLLDRRRTKVSVLNDIQPPKLSRTSDGEETVLSCRAPAKKVTDAGMDHRKRDGEAIAKSTAAAKAVKRAEQARAREKILIERETQTKRRPAARQAAQKQKCGKWTSAKGKRQRVKEQADENKVEGRELSSLSNTTAWSQIAEALLDMAKG